MNKIIFTDDNYILNLNNNIKFSDFNEENSFIKNFSLDILNDSNLEIEYNIKEEIKLNLFINISENVKFNLIDKKNGENIKIKYNYKLEENSNLIVNKINDCNVIKEFDLVNLNGKNSNVKYVLKTICNDTEHYDIIVNHNEKNTKSEVITNGINIENGKMIVNVTGFVPNGSTNSDLNQNNRIINLTNNKCQINPNLLIDENVVDANHSAHISNFEKEDLFYIMSRGIDYNNALLLLIKGFLNNNLENDQNEYIQKLISKYWR